MLISLRGPPCEKSCDRNSSYFCCEKSLKRIGDAWRKIRREEVSKQGPIDFLAGSSMRTANRFRSGVFVNWSIFLSGLISTREPLSILQLSPKRKLPPLTRL